MQFEQAKRRLLTLKGHVNPTRLAEREMKRASFDVEAAQQALWAILPEQYFATFEALSKLSNELLA